LNIQEKQLQGKKADAEKREKEADTARKAVEQASAQMQHLLDSTRSDIRALANRIEQERLRAEAAAARARIQAEEAAQRAAAQAAQANGGNDGGGGSFTATSAADIGVDPGSIPAPSSGAGAAIAYARAQIGKPYIYAGVGPDGYDCSGLTMMAWAQGGVSM